jgi:hypothetical protein
LASAWVYWLVGISTRSLRCLSADCGSTLCGAMMLTRSDDSMLRVIGSLLPYVITEVEFQYWGLNAFWIISR